MPCPACLHENAEDSRFCGECGASLPRAIACSGCRRSIAAGQKFCNGCGDRIGERRAHLTSAAARRPSRPHSVSGAELAAVLGDDVTRGHLLREAQEGYDEIGTPGHAERLTKELGS